MKNTRRLAVLFLSLLALAPAATTAWSRTKELKQQYQNVAATTSSSNQTASGEDQCLVTFDFVSHHEDFERQMKERFKSGFGSMILYSITIGGGIMGLVTALVLYIQQRKLRLRSGDNQDDRNVGTDIKFNVNMDGTRSGFFNDEDLDIAFDGIKLSLKQKVEVEKKTIENGKEVITKKKKVRSRYLLDGSLRGCASAGRMLAISKFLSILFDFLV